MDKRFSARAVNAIRWRMKAAVRHTRRFFYRLKHGRKIMLVYSMGKVGTTSVYLFFKRQHPEIPVFHLHFLSDYWVNEKLPGLPPEFHINIKVAGEVKAALARMPGHRIQIITMVREPLVREISDIFQNWQGLFGIQSISELSEEKLRNYLDAHDHEYVLNWFDTEFKAWTGFDIYSVPFDKKKGYGIYKTAKADILCIKTEQIDSCIEKAMMEFTGLKMVTQRSANTSSTKEGKELYGKLVQQYKAPAEKMKVLYGSRYVRHFYSDEEIAGFVRRWSREEEEVRGTND